MGVRLERMTTATAAALLEGRRPSDIPVAEDYPTEFSRGVAAQVANGSDLGPYVIYPPTEAVVVGEIGGAFTGAGTVEIGYAVVQSHWGRGVATGAVRGVAVATRRVFSLRREGEELTIGRGWSGRQAT
jgi:RimJ/RimL family protein N-acetyltransferase